MENVSVEENITIWPFESAPEIYRWLSDHGGDEDFITFVPSRYIRDARPTDDYHKWMVDLDDWVWRLGLAIDKLGCYSTSWHPVEGGFIAIGAHS